MKPKKRTIDVERKESDRKARRRLVQRSFSVAMVILICLLVWKLSALILPIVVGALLAYLFRPVRDQFQVSWIPHEMRVLILFACVGYGVFAGVNQARKLIPDEKQELELKVRLKYKVNEKFQELVGENNPEKQNSPITSIISREAGPMVDQLNSFLELSPYEIDLFQKYRTGFKGQPPIEDRFYDYFQANLTTNKYDKARRTPASSATISNASSSHQSESDSVGEHKSRSLMEELSIWVLSPLIFIFLGFDNGQMRRYTIGLVPNRYFELSLTVLDMLDDAIGKYLRGTLMECGLVGLTLTIGLFLLGIPLSLAVAIGIISGLANAIPFLGPAIGLMIALGYSLIAENIQPILPGLNSQDLAIYVIVLVGIAHLLDNIIYQPIVLGSAVNLHPLVVIIAIIAGSTLLGVWGMLLAIPTVVVVKTAVETLFKELKDYRII